MQFCQFDWNDWISRKQSNSWCSGIQRGAQDPCFSKSWEVLISPTSEMKRIKKSSSWLILVRWLNSESARLSADLTDHVWFFQMCSKVITEASYFYSYWLLYVICFLLYGCWHCNNLFFNNVRRRVCLPQLLSETLTRKNRKKKSKMIFQKCCSRKKEQLGGYMLKGS